MSQEDSPSWYVNSAPKMRTRRPSHYRKAVEEQKRRVAPATLVKSGNGFRTLKGFHHHTRTDGTLSAFGSGDVFQGHRPEALTLRFCSMTPSAWRETITQALQLHPASGVAGALHGVQDALVLVTVHKVGADRLALGHVGEGVR